LSIFETPTSEQFDKWLEIDSVYIKMVSPMVEVYKGSAKLNFNGNPWENKRFQSEYSDLTWRELYDYVKYFTEIYNELGYEEGEKVLDSVNNRFDQMRDDLITWKDSRD
jgi:long-subunit acyl-CoA synthetase (AMP-forming)